MLLGRRIEDAAQDVSRLNVIQPLTKFNQGSLSSSDGNRIVYDTCIPMHVTDCPRSPTFAVTLPTLRTGGECQRAHCGWYATEKHSKKDQESILIAEFTRSGLYKEISDKLLNDPELKLKSLGINGFN